MKKLVVNKEHFKDIVITQSGKVFTKPSRQDVTNLKCNPELDSINLKEDYELRRLMEQRIIVVSSEESSDNMNESIIKEQKSKKNDIETQEALDAIKEDTEEEKDENESVINELTEQEESDSSEKETEEIKNLE